MRAMGIRQPGRLGLVAPVVTATLAIPGERREVELFEDERVEIERIYSDAIIGDESELDEPWRLDG